MTDPHDPLQPDAIDELASAHLDGQTTASEAARIAADPVLLARVADLAAVRAAVQLDDGGPPDEGRREDAIAAALAAFDEVASDGTVGSGGVGASAPLTPITAISARRGASRRTLRLVGAAAVAVAAALAVPLLGRLDSDPSGDDLAAKVQEETGAGGDARAATADDSTSAAGAEVPAPETFAVPAGAPVDLGAFDDLATLEDAVRAQVSSTTAADLGTPTTVAPTAGPPEACPGVPEPRSPDAGSLVLRGTARLDDRPVIALVYEGTDGQRTLVVVDADDCAVVLTRRL
jgi:hypothetical protein